MLLDFANKTVTLQEEGRESMTELHKANIAILFKADGSVIVTKNKYGPVTKDA